MAGVYFKHLNAVIPEKDIENFQDELEELLRKYAGVDWTYTFTTDDTGEAYCEHCGESISDCECDLCSMCDSPIEDCTCEEE